MSKKQRTGAINTIFRDLWADFRKSIIQPVLGNIGAVIAPVAKKATENLLVTLAGGAALTGGAVAGAEAAGVPVVQTITAPVAAIVESVRDEGPAQIIIGPRSLGQDCSGESHPSAIFQNIQVQRGAGVLWPVEFFATPPYVLRLGEVSISNFAISNLQVQSSTVRSLLVEDTDTDGYAITPASGTTTEPIVAAPSAGPLEFGASTSTIITTTDHLYISATTGDCDIGRLDIVSVSVSGGNGRFTDIEAGAFAIVDSQIGDGDGPDNPDLDIGSTVTNGGGTTVANVDHLAGVNIR